MKEGEEKGARKRKREQIMEDRGTWLRRLGPHQLASDCPVILLTHLRKTLNGPLSAGT